MRTHTTRAASVAALVAATVLLASGPAPAASRSWRPCDKAATKAAAEQAGLPQTMDADRRLQLIFEGDAQSSVLTTVVRSLCADFDGDGDLDRLALYKCCTVSSPSPLAILRNVGAGYAIAYARLHDVVFGVRAVGRDVVEREPKYATGDPNCCPSQIRERRIHWTGSRFKSSVRVRPA